MANRKKLSLDELHLGQSTTNLINETELNFIVQPRLYMTITSPPVRSVLMVASAVGVPLQLIPVNLMQGEHMDPEYVKKNPQHTIPMLEENGFVLWDSHAIAGYLVTAYGRNDDLYPQEPRRRALIDQRLHFDSSVLFPSIRATVLPIMSGSSNSIPQERIDAFNEGFKFLEMFLENNTWLVGENETIADICTVATISSINEIYPINKNQYPRVFKWFGNCKKLPYYEENNVKGARMFGDFIKSQLKSE